VSLALYAMRALTTAINCAGVEQFEVERQSAA
jgi:hypothetical protein